MPGFRNSALPVAGALFALATGVALGAGPLEGDVGGRLDEQGRALAAQDAQLRVELAAARREAAAGAAFADRVGPDLVAGRLARTRVVVLRLPGADDAVVRDLRTTLRQAGATVTGDLAVLPSWLDPQQRTVLDTLASQLVPAGVRLPSGSAYDRAATVLGAALLTRGQPAPAAGPAASTTVTALREAGLVRFAGVAPPPAQLALVVAGLPAGDPAPLAALAAATDAMGRGTVVAGPTAAAGAGGVLAAIRTDARLAAAVSTTGAADTAHGRVAAAYALEEQARGGGGGYADPGAPDGPVPKLAAAR